MTTQTTTLPQWEVNIIHDYYIDHLENNISLAKPGCSKIVPGNRTISVITYGSNVYIASNTRTRHSELNCWDLLQNKRKKLRKRMDVFITEVRCKLVNNKFEYSMSQPCLHCTKTFQKYAKYLYEHYGSTIYFRWSTDSGNEPLITKYKDIREINNSTISTGWALKYNRL